jgi:hypothetical protein
VQALAYAEVGLAEISMAVDALRGLFGLHVGRLGLLAQFQTTPISPPSGPIQWLFQGPPAESKLLAAKPPMQVRERLPSLTRGQKRERTASIRKSAVPSITRSFGY